MDENLSVLCNYVMLLIGEYLECGSSYFNKNFFFCCVAKTIVRGRGFFYQFYKSLIVDM
jgi:hypothetical protein